MNSVTVRLAWPGELPWINGRYAEIGFQSSDGHDLIAVAEVDGQRVGLGRIVPLGERDGELGGMLVLPAWRGQAVAGRIVEFLLSQPLAARHLFCLPFAHLRAFYERHGFMAVSACVTVPAPMTTKLAWCQGQYPDPVCLLHRPLKESRPS